jgi:hypothetical protein
MDLQPDVVEIVSKIVASVGVMGVSIWLWIRVGGDLFSLDRYR